MRTFYKRFAIVTGFVLLLILLFANTLITKRQLAVQIRHGAWVSHSRQVLLELSQTDLLLKDAETGQRGYLYTGDPRYLRPYDFAFTQIEPHIQNLARLTADNPTQQTRIPVLRRLAQEKLGELAQTINVFRAVSATNAPRIMAPVEWPI